MVTKTVLGGHTSQADRDADARSNSYLPEPLTSSTPSDHTLTPLSVQSLLGTVKPFDSNMKTPLRKHLMQELLKLSEMAGPLFLQNIFSYSTSVIAVAFVGHLNDPSLLSSAVLANSLYNVTGYSVISGLSAGMETLCGQAYGARSYKTLGLVLQHALLITWLVCVPISVMWAHAEPLLLALGQHPNIAQGAARYLWVIMPTLYIAAMVECLKRYLLAQQVVVPGMIATVITCCLCPVYNWLLIFRYQLGLHGASVAFVLSQGTACVLLLAYTIWRDATMAAAQHEAATWVRPAWSAFAGWGKYLSYGVPAAAMICMEWWCYEVVIFMAGIADNAEVAVGVMGVAFQISAMAYMSAMAYGSSVNTRVGNELGAGNGEAARLSMMVGVAVVAVVQTCLATATWFAGPFVIGLLSNSQAVQALSLGLLPILLPTFVGDAINAVCQAVLRGAGRQALGAAMNALWWFVGVPLAALFGLHLKMSVKGFWLGLLCTTFTQNILQLLVISRFDWSREVERAAALNAEHEQEALDEQAALLADAVRCRQKPVSLQQRYQAASTGSDVPSRPRLQQHRLARCSADSSSSKVDSSLDVKMGFGINADDTATLLSDNQLLSDRRLVVGARAQLGPHVGANASTVDSDADALSWWQQQANHVNNKQIAGPTLEA